MLLPLWSRGGSGAAVHWNPEQTAQDHLAVLQALRVRNRQRIMEALHAHFQLPPPTP
ncbi:hypothetical protein [Deinococcus carri]|uniref:hypothetical protein n=1 Tax=Deinococcus carri TaxID=1211323 RepID=UPI0031E8B168